MKLTWVGVVVLVATGCASNISSLQTAKTLEPGQIRPSFGAGLYLPIGQAVNAISLGINVAKKASDAAANNQQFTLSDQELNDLLTAGIALGTSPPTPGYELAVRVGIIKNLEAGLRYSGSSLRLDAKYRLLHRSDEGRDNSFDLALGIGVSRYFFEHPLIKLLEKVHLGDFSRWDVEVPVYISYDLNTHFGFYGVPKYIFSRTSFDEQLVEFSESCKCEKINLSLPSKVDSHFIGATVGLRAGWPVFSVFFEMTLGQTISKPTVFGQPRDLSGFTLYPAFGVAATFR